MDPIIKPNALKYLYDYEQSKQLEQNIFKNELELVENPNIQLNRENRKRLIVEEALKDKREYMKDKLKFLDEQWNELEGKELQFRENFKNYSKFIRENQGKRQRAENQIEENRKNLEHKDEEIEKEIVYLKKLEEYKLNMNNLIKQHSIYEQFLSKVIDSSNDFKSVDEIIEKYETMIGTRQKLGDRQEVNLHALEKAKGKMARFLESSNLTLVGFYNRLAQLASNFEEATMRSRMWDTVVTQIRIKAAQRYSEIIIVLTSIWNTYKLLHSYRAKPSEALLRRNEVEAQATYIKNALKEMRMVCTRLERNKTVGSLGVRRVSIK